LAARSPPRLSRWRLVWPDEAGSGLTPHKAANDASDRSRPGLSPGLRLEVARGNVVAAHGHGAAWGLDGDETVSNDAVATVDQRSEDGWTVHWVLAQQEGALVARSVHVEPESRATPAGGVTANLLRELSPSTAAAAASQHIPAPGSFEELQLRWARRDLAESGLEPEPRRGPGRPRVSNADLAEVAVAYLDELKRGRGVLSRLAARLQLATADTARDRVRMARARGFLGPAPKSGRRGGVAGPRLLDYMDELQRSDEGEGQ
jgi:hypothetical protein